MSPSLVFFFFSSLKLGHHYLPDGRVRKSKCPYAPNKENCSIKGPLITNYATVVLLREGWG